MTGTSSRRNKKEKLPEWPVEPIKDFLDYLQRLDQFLLLSIRGVGMITSMPQMVDALAHYEAVSKPLEDQGQQRLDQLQRAQKMAELAKREFDEGFPLLHSQALVSQWGGLEALIRTFLARWLTNEPNAILAEPIQRLRIRLGEYETLDENERPYYILELLENEIKAPLRDGVSRFECLLGVFGLSGEVDETDRKNLYEMQQLRNVIVHRRSVADRRLIEACPWLGLKTGDLVTIKHEAYRRYTASVVNYVTELIVRAAVYFGRERSEFLKDIKNRKMRWLPDEEENELN